MPKRVDREERLREIGAAALEVARRDGLDRVTFRSVAAELGAVSTTVVTHYVESHQALVSLMLTQFFSAAERFADPLLSTLPPRDALALLSEAILPLNEETRLLASITMEAALEFGTAENVGDELESWASWLHTRVHSLVSEITPDHSQTRADALLATLAGISMYGLVDRDNWPPERQRAALAELLNRLDLDDRQP